MLNPSTKNGNRTIQIPFQQDNKDDAAHLNIKSTTSTNKMENLTKEITVNSAGFGGGFALVTDPNISVFTNGQKASAKYTTVAEAIQETVLP